MAYPLNRNSHAEARQASTDVYSKALDAQIRDLVAGGSPASFSELVRGCKGAFPSVVARALSNLLGEMRWTTIPALGALRQKEDSSRLSGLEGNPVLSSWYFSSDTCAKIAELRDWSGARIAFLGTPRLYEWFANRHLGTSRALFEVDTTVLQALADMAGDTGDVHVTYDARDEIPDPYVGEFDIVFFDPPWYPEYYATWLARAHHLAPAGTFIFSLFPVLTRPGATAERNAVMHPLLEAGVKLWTLSAFADYAVPSFERAELQAAGIAGIDSWKTADIVVAELSDLTDIATFKAIPLEGTPWVEVNLGAIRFFVDVNQHPHDHRLVFLPAGWTRVLTSPSRRDPQRSQANVLTSRGHGFMTSDPCRLVARLKETSAAAMQGDNLRRALASADIDRESRQLLDSIIFED